MCTFLDWCNGAGYQNNACEDWMICLTCKRVITHKKQYNQWLSHSSNRFMFFLHCTLVGNLILNSVNDVLGLNLKMTMFFLCFCFFLSLKRLKRLVKRRFIWRCLSFLSIGSWSNCLIWQLKKLQVRINKLGQNIHLSIIIGDPSSVSQQQNKYSMQCILRTSFQWVTVKHYGLSAKACHLIPRWHWHYLFPWWL